jgi:hypothetical protein
MPICHGRGQYSPCMAEMYILRRTSYTTTTPSNQVYRSSAMSPIDLAYRPGIDYSTCYRAIRDIRETEVERVENGEIGDTVS